MRFCNANEHIPSTRYRELHDAQIAAHEAFKSDVESGGCPSDNQMIVLDAEAITACLDAIEAEG